MDPFLAGCAATWLHGDIAKHQGKGLIAEDLVNGISGALKRLKNGKHIRKRTSKKSTRFYNSI